MTTCSRDEQLAAVIDKNPFASSAAQCCLLQETNTNRAAVEPILRTSLIHFASQHHCLHCVQSHLLTKRERKALSCKRCRKGPHRCCWEGLRAVHINKAACSSNRWKRGSNWWTSFCLEACTRLARIFKALATDRKYISIQTMIRNWIAYEPEDAAACEVAQLFPIACDI